MKLFVVAILFVLSICTSFTPEVRAADDPAPAPAAPALPKLNNDAKYREALDKVLKSNPLASAPQQDKFNYLQSLVVAEFRARDLNMAEQYARQFVKFKPDFFGTHDTLAVALGKVGKYEEAITEAKKAIELGKPPALHANLVLAWLEVLAGKKDDGAKRIAALAVPDDEPNKRSYYGSLTTYYAAAGDEVNLQDAIGKALALDKQGAFMDVLARDVAFDAYRGKDWFIKLVGKTLAD